MYRDKYALHVGYAPYKWILGAVTFAVYYSCISNAWKDFLNRFLFIKHYRSRDENYLGLCSYQNQASPYRSKQSTAKSAVLERASWTPPRGMGRIAQMEGALRPMNELVIKANHHDMFLGMAMEANIFCEAQPERESLSIVSAL